MKNMILGIFIASFSSTYAQDTSYIIKNGNLYEIVPRLVLIGAPDSSIEKAKKIKNSLIVGDTKNVFKLKRFPMGLIFGEKWIQVVNYSKGENTIRVVSKPFNVLKKDYVLNSYFLALMIASYLTLKIIRKNTFRRFKKENEIDFSQTLLVSLISSFFVLAILTTLIWVLWEGFFPSVGFSSPTKMWYFWESILSGLGIYSLIFIFLFFPKMKKMYGIKKQP